MQKEQFYKGNRYTGGAGSDGLELNIIMESEVHHGTSSSFDIFTGKSSPLNFEHGDFAPTLSEM